MMWYFIGWIVVRLLVLAIVVLSIYKIVTVVRDREGRRKATAHGVRILRQRFASGEIDEAEYRQRLSVLKA
jgi:uncharacterized membrane protein